MAFIFSNSFYDFLVFALTIIGLLYYALVKRYSYWKSKGLDGPEPDMFFGNMKNTILGREQLGMNFTSLYFKNKKNPYVGIFMAHRPTLFVTGLEAIKSVLSKDFAHFVDHGPPLHEDIEPLSGHLFNTCGKKWKNLRVKLTPTFTSSKMKYMYDTFVSRALELDAYLEETVPKDDILSAKDLMGNFGNDVIAACAFGIECNSFKNPDDQFRKMGKKLITPTALESIVTFSQLFLPNSKLLTKLRVSVVGKEAENFFYKICEETVNYREKNGIVRNDFMQLLMQLKNTGTVDGIEDNSEPFLDDGTRLTMMQLAAQVFVFFIAGFETSSTTSSFALYELALNPDIQKTLTTEIDEVLEKHNGKVTYESLKEMEYLTKVIEETLRKYPPLPLIFRVCTKDYVIPGTGIVIEKDTPVMIPIYGIQRDPDYFPDPDKFDPERFSPENKAARHNFSYLPFGEGPRICIGNRFGMMQVKLGLVTILSKYEVSVCEKTLIPMKYDKKSFVLACEGGLWLRLKKRTK